MDIPALLAQAATTAPTEVDVNPARETAQALDGMLEGLFNALPRIGVALAVLLVFTLVARLTQKPIERRLTAAKTKSFGKVFSSLIRAGIVVAGLFVAIPIASPNVDVATMLGGLGLLGVAAGFAFQDILSNLLSGILLLIRDPFRSGDQIEVNGITGTVQLITIRETQIVTYGGRLVYVPNADVYKNAIEVQTAHPVVRTSLLVGVDYDADLPLARAVALEVLRNVEGVVEEPAPEAYYTEFGASSITLDLRYWTGSRQAEIRRVQDRVVELVKAAYDDAGIDIPFDIVTLDASRGLEDTLRRARHEDAGLRTSDAGPRAGDGRGGNGDGGTPGDLRELTRAELYELAQRAELEGRSQMTKDELVAALRSLDA